VIPHNASAALSADRRCVRVPGLRARILFCAGPDGERIELFEYD
jgi:hypothetical protein